MILSGFLLVQVYAQASCLETGLCSVENDEITNPNGFNPFFDWAIVHADELLEKYNVTYLDLINKPVQVKILLQSVYEDGLDWWELVSMYAAQWDTKFNNYTDFTIDFNARAMLVWARDMEDIVEETMSIINRAMVDSEQILYPWLIYQTDSVRDAYVDPYVTAIVEVVQWSGDSFYRYWTMIFGLNGWVPVGRGWIEKWNNDFEYHRLSDVTRNMRSMAEEFKVTFG